MLNSRQNPLFFEVEDIDLLNADEPIDAIIMDDMDVLNEVAAAAKVVSGDEFTIYKYTSLDEIVALTGSIIHVKTGVSQRQMKAIPSSFDELFFDDVPSPSQIKALRYRSFSKLHLPSSTREKTMQLIHSGIVKELIMNAPLACPSALKCLQNNYPISMLTIRARLIWN